MPKPVLDVGERIRRGLPVAPLPPMEHVKNAAAFAFVVGMAALFVVLTALFIARFF